MTNGEERLELKFRLSDGSDIGPSPYAASTTIATLKERIIAQWPQDQKVIPKAVNDVKLIYAGKVLENTKTIAESRIPVGELPGVVSTMHVVVQPSMERKKTDPGPSLLQSQISVQTIYVDLSWRWFVKSVSELE